MYHIYNDIFILMYKYYSFNHSIIESLFTFYTIIILEYIFLYLIILIALYQMYLQYIKIVFLISMLYQINSCVSRVMRN